MTTREIAEAVGKTERSVQGWAKKTGEKISSINEKISLSSPMKPADYNLEETCMIIETGIGKNAADLYRMSAEKSQPDDRITRLENMVEKLCGAVTVLIQQKPEAKQIEFTPDRFSILAYCNLKKIQITYSEALHYGRMAAKRTRSKGLEIRKIPDERHGEVGSYPVEILNEIFEL